MLASNNPARIPLPFANSGSKNTIPTASQIGITPGAASLTDGFPPLTFTQLAAGGVPPNGRDFNGILNLLSANTQWANAGGGAKYDAAFSAAVGGYPKGAKLINSTNDGYWTSTTDGNTTNPETGGAGWYADFAALYSANGYQKLPGGLIFQWGQSAPINQGASLLISFPLAFPNAVFSVGASIVNQATATSTPFSVGVGTPSLSGMTLYNNGANGIISTNFYAIGR